jgi:hypothetical protein
MMCLASKHNSGIRADISFDDSEDESEVQPNADSKDDLMELQLWPEIKAMLVTELDQLQQRFPCLSMSKLVSSSCVHLSSDLMTKSLESSETYPLSPARLEEVTQVYK